MTENEQHELVENIYKLSLILQTKEKVTGFDNELFSFFNVTEQQLLTLLDKHCALKTSEDPKEPFDSKKSKHKEMECEFLEQFVAFQSLKN